MGGTGRCHEWPGADLADRLGATGRTVRHGIDQLRELGCQVECTTGHAGGCRLASGARLPTSTPKRPPRSRSETPA
ncbi:HTH domain-containing protein [Streptomyces sp. NBC_01276]|uniref:HTH domain-containing protein n=1 Tax=Streptomyces sp. NBC_01276 TaxID=2903808 RepID=UPI00352D04C8